MTVAGWGGTQEEKSSAFKASGNLFIAVVGAGVLGLPYAFRRSGLLLGAGFLTFVAAGALYCMLLLVRCKRCSFLHRAGRLWKGLCVCCRAQLQGNLRDCLFSAASQTGLCKQQQNEQQDKPRHETDPMQLAEIPR